VSGRRAALRVLAAPALLLALSTAVNGAASERLVVLTVGTGVNLWIGNEPLADGVNPFLSGPRAAAIREVHAVAGDPASIDAALRARTLAHVGQHPGLVARLALRKLLWTFAARELPNAADIEWQLAHSPMFALGAVPWGLGALLPLACAGALLHGRRWRHSVALLAPIAVAVLVSVVFFTNARFRIVMVPSLAVLAGIAAERVLSVRRPPLDRRAAALGALGLLAGIVLAHNGFDGVRTYRIPEIDMNTAALELADGQVVDGLVRLRDAARASPRDPAGWQQLAGSLEALGRIDAAAGAWADALTALPDDPAIAAGARAFAARHRGPGGHEH
jgi:hypothetical protein